MKSGINEESLNKLIGICYSLVLTATSEGRGRDEKSLKGWMNGKSDVEKAEWVTQQLEGCGFPTYPIGSSWGRLDMKKYLAEKR